MKNKLPSRLQHTAQMTVGTALMLSFVFALTPLAGAATLNWTATSGTDLNWATSGNWTPAGPPGPADTVWFNNNAVTNGTGPDFVNNIITASTNIAVLQYSNNTAGFSHNTVLNPGVTLMISNNAVAVDNLLDGTAVNLAYTVTNTISGPGAKLVITNSLGRISIRSTSGGNTLQNSMLDLSGLDTLNAGIARLLVGSDAVLNREVGTLFLARTNTINLSGTAPAMSIGDNPSNGVGANNDPTNQESFLYLGQTNAILADSITVGRQKSSGAMLFNPAFTNSAIPSVYIRGASASRVANFSISDDSALGNSNQRSLGLVDFSGGTVDAMIGTCNVGLGKNGNNTSTFASENGTLTFYQGTIDVNTLNVGCAFVATSTGIGPIGTVNINGAGTLIVNTAMNLAKAGATPATPSQGTFNINGGTVIVKGSILSGGGISTINLNSGVLDVTNSGAVVGTLGLPISSMSFSNTTVNLAPTLFSTNVVTASLNGVAGTTNKINIASLPAFTNYPAQLPFIQFSANAGDLTTFVLGSLPSTVPPYQGYMTNDGVSQIYLVLTNGPIGTPPSDPKAVVWNGATNGVPNGRWDTTTTNWTSSGVPTNYANVTTTGAGDTVTFDDTLTGTANVSLTTTLSPGGITVNNTFSNYVFGGTGRISGQTGLTQNGSGTLTLTESGGDDFSGGITVNNGTVIIDNDSSGISGGTLINAGTLQLGNNDGNGVVPSGPLTNNGTLIFNRNNNTLIMSTVIAGTGTLIHNGTGTVTLSGVETMTGTAVVNAGTLAFAGPNANPSGISRSSGLTINNGGTVQVNIDNALAGSTGKLPVTINAGGTLTGLGSLNGGSGASSHLAGLLTLNGGTLTDGGTQLVLGNGTWDLDGGVAVPGGPVTSTIQCLSVIPHQTGGTLFSITNGTTPSGIDLLVSGTFINGTGLHDTGFIKDGPGTMALISNNTYILGTTINGGTLQLGSPNDTAALTSPLGIGGAVAIANPGSVLNLVSSQGVTIDNVINDDGNGLVLVSRGTNYFTAANNYSGTTLVKGGILALTGFGSINNSAFIIVSNATLDASASSSPITSSGSLSLTNSTFNLGSNLVTSLNSLAITNSTLILAVNTTTPSIILAGATGTLTTGGKTNLITITSLADLAVFPTNVALIKYTAADPGITNANNVLTTLGVKLSVTGNPTGYLTNNVGNSSIDLVVLTGPSAVNTTPTNITAVLSGNTLTLSWPPDYTGWHLQAQTNPVTSGVGTNWVTIPNSDLSNSYTNTVNTANGTVFYRMVYP